MREFARTMSGPTPASVVRALPGVQCASAKRTRCVSRRTTHSGRRTPRVTRRTPHLRQADIARHPAYTVPLTGVHCAPPGVRWSSGRGAPRASPHALRRSRRATARRPACTARQQARSGRPRAWIAHSIDERRGSQRGEWVVSRARRQPSSGSPCVSRGRRGSERRIVGRAARRTAHRLASVVCQPACTVVSSKRNLIGGRHSNRYSKIAS